MIKKILKKLIITIFLGAVVITIVLVGKGYLDYQSITSANTLENKVNELRSSDNYVKLNDISDYLKHGVIAIEDKRFYDHGAIDLQGTIRAVVVNIESESLSQGGSTLTQQLAKNFYFKDGNGGTNKIAEAFVANELENKYSKDEILEMYLNLVYYGDNNYGIYEASTNYFNCQPKDLSLAQASMLAGLPQAPSAYALSNHNEQSYERRSQVLKAMLNQNYINNDEYKQAMNERVN